MNLEEFKKEIIAKEKFAPVVTLDHEGKKVIYGTPSQTTLWRVDTIYQKEPDTIAWIAKFDEDDVLLDVGANVGMYTVWAAVTRGCRVFAFEPESQNYAQLSSNLRINKLSDRVVAYCMALSDAEEYSVLNLSEFRIGGSNHTFKENVDFHLKETKPIFKQGCYASTLDLLVERGVVPVPQHIKIDVDGIEHRVVAGMEETLKGEGVKSVLIEINTHLDEHQKIISDMKAWGFTYSEEEMKASIGRQDGTKFAGVGNYIFYKEGAMSS